MAKKNYQKTITDKSKIVLKINRGVFAFNKVLDGVIFEPLAKGYRYLPSPIRTGTSNFVGNVSTLLTIPNNVLQGDLGVAGKNTLRFVVNTTIGIVGLFDPASAIGLNAYEKEDFGQTLGKWGTGEGCYLFYLSLVQQQRGMLLDHWEIIWVEMHGTMLQLEMILTTFLILIIMHTKELKV